MSKPSRKRHHSTTEMMTADRWERQARAQAALLRPCHRCGSRRAEWYHATVADPDLPAVVQFCLCRRCAERHLLAVVREYVVETEERIGARYGRPFRFGERAQIAVCLGPFVPEVAA